MEKVTLDPENCEYNDQGVLECGEADVPQCTDNDNFDAVETEQPEPGKSDAAIPDDYEIV